MKKQSYYKTKQQGITLIILVITIIILLILVGIASVALTGENGILNKAKIAKSKNAESTAKEKVQIAIMGSYKTDGKIDLDELNTNLETLEGIDKTSLPIHKLPAIIKIDSYEITIQENGYLTIQETEKEERPTTPEEPAKNIEVGNLVQTTEKNNYQDAKGNVATIPANFIIVPGCSDIEEGLVISDDLKDTEENQKIANGNQFVWIPVTEQMPYQRNTEFENQNISKTAYDDSYLPEEVEEKLVKNAGRILYSKI